MSTQIQTESHYTAVVEINKTTTTTGNYQKADDRTVDRNVEKIVVRAETLDKLREKLSKRVELIEE